MAGDGTSRQGLLRQLWNLLRGRQASLGRLAAEIEVVATELTVRGGGGGEDDDEAPWSTGASGQLAAARTAVAAGNPEVGWSNLLQARRLLLHGTDQTSPEGRIELRARATAIRAEAEEKLDGWRLEAVRELLPRPAGDADPGEAEAGSASAPGDHDDAVGGNTANDWDGGGVPNAGEEVEGDDDVDGGTVDVAAGEKGEPVPSPSALYAAAEILDGRHGNVHRRVALVRKQVLALGLVEIVGVVGFLAVATFWESPFAAEPGSASLLVAVGLFGLMGASVGRLVALVGASRPEKLPALAINWWTTLGRTLMGAAAALALYAFLHSGLVAIGGVDVASPTFGALVLAVSFAAGFSERLLQRAIEAVGGTDRPESSATERRVTESSSAGPVEADDRDAA